MEGGRGTRLGSRETNHRDCALFAFFFLNWVTCHSPTRISVAPRDCDEYPIRFFPHNPSTTCINSTTTRI